MAAMKNPAERERATCALAMFHIKRGNADAIDTLSQHIDKLFPRPSTDLKAQLLRIQLWNDLAAEQRVQRHDTSHSCLIRRFRVTPQKPAS